MTKKIIYCYYTPTSYKRPDGGKFQPSDIDPTLITHLAYYAFGVHENGIVRHLDTYLDLEEKLIERILELKEINPKLKVIAVFGGWDQGSETFSEIAAYASKRTMFTNTAVGFCKRMKFDGLELDWCYPNQRHSLKHNDKDNFSALIAEIKQECLQNGLQCIISVGATKWAAEKSYNIPAITSFADYVLLKTYDLHGPWEKTTGAHTALFDRSGVSVDECVNHWINNGAQPEKLLLGLAFYGQTYTLKSPKQYSIRAEATGPGEEGPFTKMAGRLSYNEIVSDKEWVIEWDDWKKVPVAHKVWQWASFENSKSIEIKCNYAKAKKLSGVMIYSIDYDDFNGSSGSKFPLLNSVNFILSKPWIVS